MQVGEAVALDSPITVVLASFNADAGCYNSLPAPDCTDRTTTAINSNNNFVAESVAHI